MQRDRIGLLLDPSSNDLDGLVEIFLTEVEIGQRPVGGEIIWVRFER